MLEGKDGLLFDSGKPLVRYTARDLIKTAYISLTNGTKTALATAGTGKYLDLYQITMTNTSTAAITVTLTDESTTVLSVPVPASDSINYHFPVPMKQSATGVAWYADMGDFTNTTVNINANFAIET